MENYRPGLERRRSGHKNCSCSAFLWRLLLFPASTVRANDYEGQLLGVDVFDRLLDIVEELEPGPAFSASLAQPLEKRTRPCEDFFPRSFAVLLLWKSRGCYPFAYGLVEPARP